MSICTMHRIISQSGLMQKKLFSRCTKGHRPEMVLYNENLQSTKAVGVRFGNLKNKDLSSLHGFTSIRSTNMRILCMTEDNFVVLNIGSGFANIPVIEERIDNLDLPTIRVTDLIKLYAKTGDKETNQPTGRIGRLDAANEAGFFHRTDRSRLKEIKKKLKDKPAESPTEPKKT